MVYAVTKIEIFRSFTKILMNEISIFRIYVIKLYFNSIELFHERDVLFKEDIGTCQ